MRGEDGDRLALFAAVAFAALYLASAFVVKSPPKPSATADAVRRYFIDHKDGVRAAGYLAMLAGIPYLVFLAALRRRLAAAPGWLADTAFGAAIVVAGLASVGLLIRFGLTLHGSGAQASTVASVFDVARYVAPSATGVVFILALAVGLGAVRHALLPGWVGAASLAYAVYEILESFTLLGSSGAFAPGQTVNLIGTLGFLAWAVVVGVGLVQPSGSADTDNLKAVLPKEPA
jgi:hypothetical protein